MRFSKNIEILEVKNDLGCVHPVLIIDNNNLILVDTAFPGQFELLSKAIEDAGFKVSDINKIILTHQDIDHIGNINEFIASCENLTISAHKDEVPYIQGDKTPIKVAKMEADFNELPNQMKEFYPSFKTSFENRRVKIDTVLNDGEVLAIAGGIEIIHTPGHTPGHICLYIKKEKLLIAGDALNVNDGKLTGPSEKYSQDMQLALASVEKLKSYDIEDIICYHGGLVHTTIIKF